MARKTVTADFKIFPERLSLLMKERNLKQQDLGNALGVKRQTVSLYMTGQSMPDAEQVKKIATFFDVSADWLLGISDVSSPDGELRQVCKYTGLSELAVYWVRSLKEDALNEDLFILNTLIESGAIEDLLAYIGETRNTQRQIQMNRNGIEELNSVQEDALVRAKKILENAGIKSHQIIENYTLLNYQKSAINEYFQSMIDIMLFSDSGELNAAKT